MKQQDDLFISQQFDDHVGWHSWLHDELPIPEPPSDAPVVLDLFGGCGGLALGFEVQGFKTIGFEMKPEAVETYRTNLDGVCHEVLLEIGIPDGKADVIVGGPPCQPFSQAGHKRGFNDSHKSERGNLFFNL